MWIFNTDGFFSAVESKKEPGTVIVRGRFREDLEKAAKRFGTEMHETPESDYRYRVFVTKEEWGEYLKETALKMDYSNFKDTVFKRQEPRIGIYHEVWAEVYRGAQWLEERERE